MLPIKGSIFYYTRFIFEKYIIFHKLKYTP